MSLKDVLTKLGALYLYSSIGLVLIFLISPHSNPKGNISLVILNTVFWSTIWIVDAWWRHQMETFSASLAFVRGIHRSPVNSPHKGQWRGALVLFLICAWINGWVNDGEAQDLRRHRAHYDGTVIGNMVNLVWASMYLLKCNHLLLKHIWTHGKIHFPYLHALLSTNEGYFLSGT